jgi:CRISPR/Cas system CSM-associated protein Csm3 (group 7 of RAMP superfamily)
VETSKIFTSIIEWTGDDVQEETELTKCLEPVLQSFIAEDIHVGARTSRGFGEFSVSIRKITFQFPEALAKWLDFDPYDQGAFESCLENEFVTLAVLEGKRLSLDTTIDVRFRMRGTFSVRVNTAKTMVLEDGTVQNTIPLENMKGNPVIPGTAWAGAFRHHMHDLLRDAGIQENSHEMEHLDELFGTKSKSILDFSLSEIIWGEASDKQSATVVRIAVDRFTAQPRTGALFTSKVYCGGEGTLRIRYQENKLTDQDKELLAACLCDMHLGMMPIGGEASVGRGRMEIVGLSVNGEDCLDRMKASVAVLTGKSCENDMGWLRVSSPLQIDNDREPAAIL